MTSQTPSPPNQQDAIAESANAKPAISRDIQRVVRALDASDDFAYFESRRISERDDVLTRWPLLADIDGAANSSEAG